MQESVKPKDPKPIIRFVDVCKTFRYHGTRISDDEGDEEGLIGGGDEKEETGLKPGESRMALRNINLTIRPGERVGIIGNNGSGKTTLLNIVCGVSYPTSGRVVGRGSVVPLNHLARPLNEGWNGFRNLRVLARLLGFPARVIDERRTEIASFAGMEQTISQPVSTYSRNMYARLAFAAALVIDGDIYISDDTLGVGDQTYQAKCFQRLVALCESGKTLLFATHKLKLIEQLCTRAIWLDQGQVREDGQPAAIIASYRASPADDAEGGEGSEDGDANAFAAWFKQKYGVGHPLPQAVVEKTIPIADKTDPIPDGNGEATSDGLAPGGIVSLEISPKPKPEGVIGDNAVFRIRARVEVLAHEATVDLMLEIVRGKVLVSQAFLPEPLFVQKPQELVFEMAVDSNRLPDHAYRLRLSVVLAVDHRRFISRGQLFIATNNCGFQLHPRAQSFAGDSPPALPLSTVDVDWRLIESQEPVAEEQADPVAPLQTSCT